MVHGTVGLWIDEHRLAIPQDSTVIGGKALGLFSLQRDWVPPFLVLDCEFYAQYRQLQSLLKWWQTLSATEKGLFEILLSHKLSPSSTVCTNPSKIFVRSNFADEGIEQRGKAESFAVSPDIASLLEKIEAFLKAAYPTPVFPMLQQAVEPALLGHMSNERRVSKRKDHWLVESEATSERHKLIQSGHSPATHPLEARTEEELFSALRVVGSFSPTCHTNIFTLNGHGPARNFG